MKVKIQVVIENDEARSRTCNRWLACGAGH